MSSPCFAGIILAAGKGTRMKSDLPKVLHEIVGLPLVEHVARGMRGAGVERPIIVVGFGGDRVQTRLGDGYDYVWQYPDQLGTGHAVQQAIDHLRAHHGPVIVACGDTPLIGERVFRSLIDDHRKSGATITIASAIVDDPFGYGRIVRDATGAVTEIVEQRDASEAQRAICEINSALYVFDSQTLARHVMELSNDNDQKEFLLTDVIKMVVAEGGQVGAWISDDPGVLVGVNDRWQLAEADKDLRRRILKAHAVAGVTLRDVDSIVIGPDVEIEPDAVIEMGSILMGRTKVAAGAVVGPYAKVVDCEIGAHAKIVMSLANEATIGAKASVGPYAQLRPGAKLGVGAKVGNFVEVKNAVLGPGAKLSHLSYVGDATVGEEANVGAGTITCNYDGFGKRRTNIGANAFVGSNSTLVAPLTIGEGAMIAAGSVVTKDVPADAAAFGRARQETKDGWAREFRRKKSNGEA